MITKGVIVRGFMYKPKTIKYNYTEDQKQLILKAIWDLKKENFFRDFVFVKCLFHTGRRCNSVVHITLKQLQLNNNPALWIIPPQYNKAKKQDSVVVDNELKHLLEIYIKEFKKRFLTNPETNETFIFYPYKHRDNYGRNIYNMGRSFYNRWYDYLKYAGLFETKYITTNGKKLQKHRLHDFRGTWITKLCRMKIYDPVLKIERQLNLKELSVLTGITTMQIIDDHYNKANENEILKMFSDNKNKPQP